MSINEKLIKKIKYYQTHKASYAKAHCVHYPTCSNYAVECYQKFNFFYASILSIKRILFCTKFNKKYYDPVPLNKKERLNEKENKESYLAIKEIILNHYKTYPLMEINDYLKLIYQNTFGPAHLLSDPDKIIYYIEEEKNLTLHNHEYYEDIGNQMIRLHIGKDTDSTQLKEKLLQSLVEPDYKAFYYKIEILKDMIKHHEIPLNKRKSFKYIQEYLMNGSLPLNHSEAYKKAYQIHYRVIKK